VAALTQPFPSLATLDPVEPFDPIVQRLSRLHPKVIDLTLERLQRLLARLGHPENDLPPVIHVAGTNGKGSTVAFMRAMLEAAGHKVHVLTSPHLVSFTERIRLAGRLIEEPYLVELLEECEAANGEFPITFFEMAMAAATLAFARVPADYLLLEVGLGGRYDATNIIPHTAASVITPIGIDHREFLGDTLAQIAGEKAGIIKANTPVVFAPQPAEALAVLQAEAAALSAPAFEAGKDWRTEPLANGGFRYRSAALDWSLPAPALRGRHQFANAGAALAALEAVQPPGFSQESVGRGLQRAEWPARLQRLPAGHAVSRLAAPAGPVWLDGAHNPAAAVVLAEELAGWPQKPVLIAGMLANKDYRQMLAILAPVVAQVITVPVPRSRAGLPPDALAQAAAEAGMASEVAADLPDALQRAGETSNGKPVLVAGSLYLAGAALGLDLTG
jgi:dihydrofolate synthase/folylpolyglutamate synthase